MSLETPASNQIPDLETEPISRYWTTFVGHNGRVFMIPVEHCHAFEELKAQVSYYSGVELKDVSLMSDAGNTVNAKTWNLEVAQKNNTILFVQNQGNFASSIRLGEKFVTIQDLKTHVSLPPPRLRGIWELLNQAGATSLPYFGCKGVPYNFDHNVPNNAELQLLKHVRTKTSEGVWISTTTGKKVSHDQLIGFDRPVARINPELMYTVNQHKSFSAASLIQGCTIILIFQAIEKSTNAVVYKWECFSSFAAARDAYVLKAFDWNFSIASCWVEIKDEAKTDFQSKVIGFSHQDSQGRFFVAVDVDQTLFSKI